jgi:GTP-binding protein
MFIDEITIHAKAGKGGDGVVLWLNEKGKEFSGPSGGNGGKGGDVFVEAVSDIGILSNYRHVKELKAENGGNGQKNSRHGKDGASIVVPLPVGSIVTNKETRRKVSLTEVGQKEIILIGGRGGLGNEYFKSSRNIRPTQSTPGKLGDEADFFIELELVADAGFIGLPNAGKSTLLNALTNARAKVGNFQFTTLEPNLGNFYGSILADIPGLIEGAAEGKGLGHKFLRHIKRTKMVFHVISAEEDVVTAYDTIRAELSRYGSGLLEKEEVIILSKSDAVLPLELEEKEKALSARNSRIITVSVYDENTLTALKSFLSRTLSGKDTL